MSLISLEEARALDASDTLSGYRDHFDLPEGVIYLDGNSLGPPPKQAMERIRDTARKDWGQDLIKSWNTAGWMDLPLTVGNKIAPLIGVDAGEVICIDGVTTNLFKLAGALILKYGGALAIEEGDFPTDGYVLEGLSRLHDVPLHFVPYNTPPADLPEDVSVFIKSGVHYKTAEIAGIDHYESAAQARGIHIIWDLSHATGLADLHLKADGARYAVGCGYKFLNGGPGAPAFVYVHSDCIEGLDQPLSGWMGHAAPFEFKDGYRPDPGIRRFAASTPHILSMSSLDGALDVYESFDLKAGEDKARQMGDIFLQAADELGLATISPGIGQRRGGHVCIRHPDGYAIVQALIARGIIGDFRAPDLMRFGFSPLYLSYEEVRQAAGIFMEIVGNREWDRPEFKASKTVT